MFYLAHKLMHILILRRRFLNAIIIPAAYYNFTYYYYGLNTRSLVILEELIHGVKKCDESMGLRRKK